MSEYQLIQLIQDEIQNENDSKTQQKYRIE